MTVYEFPVEVRREVENGICQHCRFDKPAPAKGGKGEEEDHRRIARITLRYKDSHGHESEICEWDERDLYGPNVSIETIVRGVELAACRDAAYQFGGECVYVLAFHGKEHTNRSRFFFKIWGGQEIQDVALSGHGKGREEVGIAERLMPDLLKYVSEKESRIDAKVEVVFGTLTKQVTQLSSVVTDYTDRELKLREIALNADDQRYEREKRHREDEEEAERKRKTWALIEEHAPKAMPYIIEAIQRFSGGPNGAAQSPEFMKWYEQQQREAQHKAEQAERAAARANGRTNGEARGSGDHGPGPEDHGSQDGERVNGHAENQGDNGAGDNGVGRGLEPSMFDQLQLRVALDTSRFVALVRARNKFEAVREALTEEQRALFDEIARASEEVDLDKEDDVQRIAGLALMFGGSVQASPAVGFALLGVLDGMSKLALVELSNLLKMYHEAMQSRS